MPSAREAKVLELGNVFKVRRVNHHTGTSLVFIKPPITEMASSSEEKRNAKASKLSDEEQVVRMDKWYKLPEEVQAYVLMKLPILSLLECRLVSRLWHAFLKEPGNATMHLKNAIANNDPCLIIFDGRSIYKLQLIADIGSARKGNPEIAKLLYVPSRLRRYDLVGSSNGLICLNNYTKNVPFYIYNPFTIECRPLPKLCTESQKNALGFVFGFGFDPASMKYKVVKMFLYSMSNNNPFSVGGNTEAFILILGTSEWRKIGNVPYELFSPTSEAEVDGKLHWLTNFLLNGQDRYREIVSLDLTTEEFRVVPRPSCGCLDKGSYHLVTLQGCLSAVVSHSDFSHQVWMMKDYNVQASWTKQFIIIDYRSTFLRNLTSLEFPPMNDARVRTFRVLCSLKNGEILVLYMNKYLVCCNPETGEVRNLDIQKLPTKFLADVHVGSLISPDTVLGIGGEK